MPRPARPTTPQHEALVEGLENDRIVPRHTRGGRHIDGMVIKALAGRGWITTERRVTDAGCNAIDRWTMIGRDEHREDCLLNAQYRVWQTLPELDARTAWITGVEWLDAATIDCTC